MEKARSRRGVASGVDYPQNSLGTRRIPPYAATRSDQSSENRADSKSRAARSAKSGKLELSGGLENSTFHHFERMSAEELDHEIDRLDKQIRCGEWSIMKGDEKDAWIDYFQDKVDRMRVDRAGGEKWNGDLRYRIRRGHPVLRDDEDNDRPMAVMPTVIDLEAHEIPAADLSLLAPIETPASVSSTGSGVSPLSVPPAPFSSFRGAGEAAGAAQTPAAAAPASPGVQTGITYAANGLAVPIIDGKNPFDPNEDLSL